MLLPSRFMRAALLLSLLMLYGCGKEPEGPTQVEQLHMMVSNAADAMGKPDRMAQLFVPGAEPSPADQAKYRRLMFHAVKSSVSGDTATIRVEVEDPEGKKLGETDWTAVNQEGTWKLQSVPLP